MSQNRKRNPNPSARQREDDIAAMKTAIAFLDSLTERAEQEKAN